MAEYSFSPSDQTMSVFKRYGMPLLFVCSLTALILIGVHAGMAWAVQKIVMTKSENVALNWATHFNAEMIDAIDIAERGSLSDNQQRVVDAAIEFSEIHSFAVFDINAELVYSSDYGVVKRQSDRNPDVHAQRVLGTGSPFIDIFSHPSDTENPDVFAHVFVPAFDTDGRAIGVIGLFMDKTESAAVYTKALSLFAWVLPALCAFLYALPSLAYVIKREQAHARTEKVALLSRFDQLTGTLNRHTMTHESKQLFANRGQLENVGVFFLDIDTFKGVNDEYGHEFGDAYLQFISSVILNNVRSDDLVGRMGGDEFVITLRKVSREKMREIGENILKDARAHFEYKGRTTQASVSIGCYLAEPSVSRKDALHAADLALYHAKATGRNAMVEYFPELDIAMLRRREIEARMRDAMRDQEFETVFQPITSPQNKKIVGFEALLRLYGNDGAPIPPSEFIPIAEESGMIEQIGAFILRDAVLNAKAWPEDVFVSVNLSPAQFKRGDLVSLVADTLQELDFPARRLEFEVTEGLLMADEQRVSDQLVGLKQMGISIAMDDFGTGYSSLGYLWKYSFDKLKIDRVFLEGFDFDKNRYGQIIETIVTLGHKMGMKVTVEGIETQGHQEMLDHLDCDQYQGFHFGKPMPADQALRALAGMTAESSSDTQ
ncbi:hypothetical protein ROLI_003260 [Roseobacter fucihabitans]|uniref:Diguanylate cyclase/phosphodiesterase n=1 Tax=Roseobacter fucihabitans TaxID=1537242 RepID=A0ABZ2BQT2_9RHOB|nr:EAL domain-containing protein [Roseobacter litoralis]MBC6963575.1 Cyclic di-GMP phosphodiesterase Gmr [Roseobacter litoralis]